MCAHANDLRVEVDDESLVRDIMADYRAAPIDEATKVLLAHAEKLTRAPNNVTERDIEALRRVGWSDRAIHDATQVVAYFNYINRIADGLGVDLEPEMPARSAGS